MLCMGLVPSSSPLISIQLIIQILKKKIVYKSRKLVSKCHPNRLTKYECRYILLLIKYSFFLMNLLCCVYVERNGIKLVGLVG